MLKTLMLKRQLDAKRSELAAMEAKDSEFVTREADLETAINEVEPGNQEQEAAVTAEIEKFENERTAHQDQKQALTEEVQHMEDELEELERSAPKPQKNDPKHGEKVRGELHMENINIRALPRNQRAFDALSGERRAAILAQERVEPRCLTLKNLGGRFAPQGTVDQLYRAFGLDARSVADSVEEMLHEQ